MSEKYERLTMTEPRACAECGALLPSGVTDVFCPDCALRHRASEELEKLCRAYWPPLYTYIRRQGHGPEEAKDLTHAFFAKLLQKNFWGRADREKGRFRSFLLAALRHFLADERDRGRTAKRGGSVDLR